ncbi:alpha-N-acetylglucosaminidase TIM-barrel domain-containing protein [Clostridium perfringens]|uniref:alpha-N-acetylglucosaminidase TIM-barrel domain-containing protein n=1 Tax=Clostridium perfringens TaxID=1502 RepID=UPI00240E2FB0|nr:alpha-N-acetylglucosaminidase TIM-barrel domain-containing protein [Clostridium perfringens]WFD88545.1 alpha-N-acetylglucosaminidase TIM-barrel domain-containing protein [Clostridium perfringens]
MFSKKFKKQMAYVLASTFVFGLVNPSAIKVRASTGVEITEGVTVTAKGNTEGNTADLAIDGDLSTYWESSNDYKWIEVDLGGIYELSKIEIFNKDEAVYKYNIYASEDGENFNKIAYKNNDNVSDSNGNVHTIDNVRAGKIRIDVVQNSNSDRVNIAEINVFGKNTGESLPEIKKIATSNFSETPWATEYEKFNSDIAYANEKTLNEIKNLVGRVIGEEFKDKFIFEIRDQLNGNDVFEVSDSRDGKVLIKGNNGVSLASGFNYYLKNYCNVSYNPIMGSNLKMPETMPSVGERVVIDTPYEYRYALNFCTYSYTMSFWDWDQYEEFLDWCAMNGVNLVLDIIGQEEVLRRTLNEFGYSDEEVKEFISGPAYFAWFYMQNMTGFGGPLPNDWFEQRAELGRKMHDRMQSFGINPVLQGYSGMVPRDFKEKNPEAQTISQGGWCGFDRPDMLKTYVNEGEVDYFQNVADVFYEKQKEVFGDVTNFYGVDPFHEGGNTGDLDNGKIYEIIQNKMIEHDNDAVWVIQNWQGNPSNNKLEGLTKKDQAMVLDLFSEVSPDWNRLEERDLPWIWNMLHNFGGRMGMDAAPEKLATEIPKALANSEHMVGIGITPEAINTNPLAYELLFDMAWTRDQINFRTWTEDYIERRYGKTNKEILDAWNIILDTAYKKRNDYYQGAAESIINARPGFGIKSASTWGHSKIVYDKSEFEKAIEIFAKNYDEFKDSDAFLYDFADILKQLLANSAQEYYEVMCNAYNNGNGEKFKFVSGKFLELIKLQERVLSTRPEFLIGNWIEDARTMLKDADDWTKDLFEFNARALVTTWGSRNNADGGGLKDYSNRQWSGLTEDYYYARWEKWINGLQAELDGGAKAPNIDWFKMEYDWVNKKSDTDKLYPTEASNENLGELAKIAMESYSVTNMDKILGENESVERVNIALGKPVSSETHGETEANPLTNITDGNTGTMWVADKEGYPASVTVDLQGVKSVDGIEFAFRNQAGDRAVAYKVEVMDESGQWKTVSDKSEDYSSKGVIEKVDFTGKAQKVKVSLTNVDLNLSPSYKIPELAEIMVYGGKEKEDEYTNVALGKPVTGAEAENGKPLANITDGDLNSLWVSNNGQTPATTSIDLQETENVEFLELHFEKPGLRFQFKVEVEDANGNKETLLDMTSNKEDNEKSYKIPVGKDINKVHVTMTGKAEGGQHPGAWAAIAEVKAMSKEKPANYVNIAENKNVSGSNSQSGNPLSNITDGDLSSLWISDNGAMPANATIDLEGNSFVDFLELHFEKEGFRFKFKVEVEDESGNRETVLDMTSNTEDNKKSYNIPVKKEISKIHATITGKADGGEYPLAWAAIAEIKAMSKEAINKFEQASIALPQGNMKATATSEHPDVGNEGLAKFAIDGKENTIWHTKYNPVDNLPQSITLELGGSYEINKFTYLPRSGSKNGNITKYEFHVSEDGNDFRKVSEGNWEDSGSLKTLKFNSTKATHVKLVALEGVGGFASAAELNVFAIPENLAMKYETKVETTSNNAEVNNLRDGNENTLWIPRQEEEKSVTFDLSKEKDISSIDIVSKGSSPLKYSIEISNDGTEWTKIVDENNNEENKAVYSNILKSGEIGRFVRFNFNSENVKIGEIKIYKGDSTSSLASYIRVVEDIYNSAVVGDMAGNYTEEAKESLGNAINEAKLALGNDINSKEANEVMSTLKSALNEFYKGFVQINRTKLAALISDVDILLNEILSSLMNSMNYNEKAIVNAEIQKLKLENNEAKEVYNKKQVSQSEIDTAYDELKNTLDSYYDAVSAETAYKSMVLLAKEKVENAVVGNGNGQYPKEAVDALNEAIRIAEEGFESSTSLEDIRNITRTLKEAIDTFVESVNVIDKAQLEEIISSIESKFENAEGVYIPNAIEELRKALDKAKEVLNNEGANEENINKAISDLTEAEAKFELSKVPNKDELNSEIERAYDVLEKLKGFDHLEGIKIKLEDAILEAERVKNDENSLKVDVDKVLGELKIVIEEALKSIDSSEVIVSPVRDFKATNISKKNVTVQWSAPENSFGLEGYVLYKDGKKVAELGKDETTYKFKGLNRHTIYNFKIAAKYNNGELSSKESITLRTER